MNLRFHLLNMPVEYDKAITYVLDALDADGMQTVLSFDLKDARSTHAGCECPNHGSDECDCQMAVFQVYRDSYPPASIMAHSRDGYTQIHLVDSPEQHIDALFEADIRKALSQIQLPRQSVEFDHGAQ